MKSLERKCDYCEADIENKRADAKYCSAPCRNAAEKRRYRERKGLAVNPIRGPYTGRSNNRRAYALKYKFGITVDQYEQMLENQNNSCAICNKEARAEGKSLAVDHDHATGEIRGLLCSYCNYKLVGRHRDPHLLRKIADYIEQGTGWFVPEKKKKRTVKRKPK